MNERGAWICRPCHAIQHAHATTRMHQSTEANANLWPWYLLGGTFLMITLGILYVLYKIGQGFGQAL